LYRVIKRVQQASDHTSPKSLNKFQTINIEYIIYCTLIFYTNIKYITYILIVYEYRMYRLHIKIARKYQIYKLIFRIMNSRKFIFIYEEFY
jgi:hypothetical protein